MGLLGIRRRFLLLRSRPDIQCLERDIKQICPQPVHRRDGHCSGTWGQAVVFHISTCNVLFNNIRHLIHVLSLMKSYTVTGPGNKIIGGYDFVGDAFTGANALVPDDDPLDQLVAFLNFS